MTELLKRLHTGDPEVLREVIPLVYAELKKLARAHLRRESGDVQMQTTALVHEAYLKLAAGSHPSYENRAHFFGIASRLMRQILVDTARARAAAKRGAALEIAVADLPDRAPRTEGPVIALEDTLQRLEEINSLRAQLIEMRYFGGMTAEESAAALSLPVHVVRRELRLAQAWLRQEMVRSL